jgi:plastocyanin
VSAAGITSVGDSSLDCTFADLDNDGRYDVITAQGESGTFVNRWYKNTGAIDTLAPAILSATGPASAPVGTVVAHAKIRDQVLDDGVDYVRGAARFVTNRTTQDLAAAIDGTGFNPAVITIQAGTTVTWTNSSGSTQSVDLSPAPHAFASGAIANGGTYAFTFVVPGTYSLSSSGGATGQVVVQGGAATEPATYSGGQIFRFAIPAPSGAELCYELQFTDWHGNVSATRAVRVPLTGGSCAAPTTYCTAKVNSQGCTPAIAWNGTPSVSAGAGFFVSATQVLNNKSGLFFYSTNGQQAVAFQGGTLCVKLPITRTALKTSGGNPPPNDCSGSYSIDFAAYVASGANPTLVAGVAVNGQFWSRDPGFGAPNNTGLTNAVHFVLCP